MRDFDVVRDDRSMTLTAGSTLQNNKYVVQSLLHQGDLGVTYQARHVFLDQNVILQTLNEVVRERGDFDTVRQQFLDGVRRLTRQDNPMLGRVLDYFEEHKLPFVVLELQPGREAPKVADWLTLLPEGLSTQTVPATAFPNTLPPEPAPKKPAPAQPVEPLLTAEAAPTATQVATVVVSKAVAPGRSSANAQIPAPVASAAAPRRSRVWVPIALLLTSLVGGLTGAGYGLYIRTQPIAKAETKSQKVKPDGFSLFTREQSFPPAKNWPITETAMPADSTYEQPVYHAPANDYAPPIDPAPAVRTYSPSAPVLRSTPDAAVVPSSPDTSEVQSLPPASGSSRASTSAGVSTTGGSGAASTSGSSKISSPPPVLPSPVAPVRSAPAAEPELPPALPSAPPSPTSQSLPTSKPPIVNQSSVVNQ